MTSGFEVSGIVDELCPTVDVNKVKEGDHVIVYPTDEEESTDSGYSYSSFVIHCVRIND